MDAFSSVVGQTSAIALLKAALSQDRIAPAYLFAGVSGIGRKLTAQAFAQMLVRDQKSQDRVKDRNHPDILWIEPTYLDKGKLLTAKEAEEAGLKRRATPQIRLEQIREIGEFLSHPPLESSRAVVIIEEAQAMAEPAANGLLKTLEEPGQATIILLAPDTDSLLPTLVSRCQRIPFYRLSNAEVTQVLNRKERSDILPEIIALSQGSPGDAIAAFAQFQDMPTEILSTMQKLPHTPREALTLAKQIAKDLEIESQLWLLDYLQNYHWRSQTSHSHSVVQLMQYLETAKTQLARYIQPRLIWEVTLLQIAELPKASHST